MLIKLKTETKKRRFF